MEAIGGDDCFRKLDLKELLIYYFFAPWCPACKSSESDFEKFTKDYEDKGVKFFKIDITDETTREFGEKCKVANIPTYMGIKDRRHVGRVIGPDFEKLKELIQEANEEPKDGLNKNFCMDYNPPPPPPPKEPGPGPREEEEDDTPFYPNEKFQGAYEGFMYRQGPKGIGYYENKEYKKEGNGEKKVEIHMVYGDWCGHSKRAKPAFEELVPMKDVKTSEGSTVSFVMTDDKSDGMSLFRGIVRGFPTYMVVIKQGINVVLMEVLKDHDRSKDKLLDATKALKY